MTGILFIPVDIFSGPFSSIMNFFPLLMGQKLTWLNTRTYFYIFLIITFMIRMAEFTFLILLLLFNWHKFIVFFNLLFLNSLLGFLFNLMLGASILFYFRTRFLTQRMITPMLYNNFCITTGTNFKVLRFWLNCWNRCSI